MGVSNLRTSAKKFTSRKSEERFIHSAFQRVMDHGFEYLYIDFIRMHHHIIGNKFSELVGHCMTDIEEEEYNDFFRQIKPRMIEIRKRLLIKEIDDNLIPIVLFKMFKYIEFIVNNIGSESLKEIFICYEGIRSFMRFNMERLKNYRDKMHRHIRNFRIDFMSNNSHLFEDIVIEENDDCKKTSHVLFEADYDFNGNVLGHNVFYDLLEEFLGLLLRERFSGVIVNFSLKKERGEGEIKIFKKIRSIPEPSTICIYGNDSDIMALSLLYFHHRIFMMDLSKEFDMTDRDYDEYGNCLKNDKFIFFDVSIFGGKILKYLGVIDNYQLYLNDFVVLLFLMGNDYLPGLYSFNNFKIFLNFYESIYVNFNNNLVHLINNLDGEWVINVSKFFYILRKIENRFRGVSNLEIGNQYQNIKRLWSNIHSSPFFTDCQIDWNVDYQKFKGKFELFDGRKSYNNLYFGNNVDDAVENYFKGIKILVKFYFDLDENFGWYYPYVAAPLTYDICRILKDKRYFYTLVLPLKPEYDYFERYLIYNDRSYDRKFPKIMIDKLDEKIQSDIRYKNYYLNILDADWIIGDCDTIHNINPRLPPINIELIREFIDSVRDDLSDDDKLKIGIPYFYNFSNTITGCI